MMDGGRSTGVAPGSGTSWLVRLAMLGVVLMLVVGVGMTSGYFGGTTTQRPPEATAASSVVAEATATEVVPTRVAGQITPRFSTVLPLVGTRVTSSGLPSRTPEARSANMATAMAISVQSTALAVETFAADATSTRAAQVAAIATSSALETARATQANSDATATAATEAQIAASQQTKQAAEQQAQQTQQAQETRQAQPVQAPPQPEQASAGPLLDVVFEGEFYKGIEIWSAAREQFGAGAVLYSRCDGLNCWYVKAGKQERPLDLKRAVLEQYGPDWTLVAVGPGRSDWRAVRFSDLNHVVLPVMLVSSDRLNDVGGITTGLARFRTVLANSQYWYYRQVGKTFRLVQPVIIPSERTSSQWNNLSGMSTSKNILAEAATTQYAKQLPKPGDNLRVLLAPYTGENFAIAQGALSVPGFAVAPALSTSIWCPQSGQLDRTCQSAAYLVGQALGLSFGLGHSCVAYPQEPRCHISLMQSGKPPDAILLQPEIEKLKQSPFFTRY